MKTNKILLITLAALTVGSFSACHKDASKTKLADKKDTINWVLGESVAKGIKASGMDIDTKMVLKAVEATLNGEKQPIDEATFTATLQEINDYIMANQRRFVEQSNNNEMEQLEKLQESNPNMKKSDDGFFYEVVKAGKGVTAKTGDVVRFDYKASFLDGRVFDQTYGNRPPITKALGNPMFPGMQNAMHLMNAGSIYRFYFPSNVAFGAQGTDDIPPYTTVVYEIELHSINVELQSDAK